MWGQGGDNKSKHVFGGGALGKKNPKTYQIQSKKQDIAGTMPDKGESSGSSSVGTNYYSFRKQRKQISLGARHNKLI